MRGFGSVPKRGAEVGGFLIGTIRPGVPAIVRIDDFEPVACEYRRGPSYLFTEEDGAGSGGRLAAAAAQRFALGVCGGIFSQPHPRWILSCAGRLGTARSPFPRPCPGRAADQALRHQGQCRRFLRSRARRVSRSHSSGVSFAAPRVAGRGACAAPSAWGALRWRAPPLVAEEPPQTAFRFGYEPALPQDSEPASARSRLPRGWVWLPLIFLVHAPGRGAGISSWPLPWGPVRLRLPCRISRCPYRSRRVATTCA